MSSTTLSLSEKNKLIARAFHSLYRWFLNRSQSVRNWNPDTSFNWKDIRHDHPSELMNMIEGFYAVEQYIPDYVSALIQITRNEFGKSQFYIRWGAEEERHADLWRNVLLFSRGRTADQIEQYTEALRNNRWSLSYEDPLYMLVYALIQERATGVIYLNLAKFCQKEIAPIGPRSEPDQVLEHVIMTIAADEVAHYEFFLAGVRLFMYYYPERTAQALLTVLRGFIMPSSQIIPNYDSFINDLYKTNVFGKRSYTQDVATVVLHNLGINNFTNLESSVLSLFSGISSDAVDDQHPLYSSLNFAFLEKTIQRIFDKIDKYESAIGINEIDPFSFSPNKW